MWDFDFSRSFGAMVKTMPFILFRMLVYIGLGVLYVLGTGVGGAIGYGVTAFGDEPGNGVGLGALIGFAGPRTIKATIGVELPDGFQTSEFLLEHGYIDRIVTRDKLKSEIARAIDYCGK